MVDRAPAGKGRIMAAPLSSDEIERYALHLLLRDVGGPGQAQLKAETRVSESTQT